MITFLNFDGSSVGGLPAGFTNTTTVPGHPGNFKVGNRGAVSSPNSLADTSGNAGGSAVWTGLLASDEAIQFDQVVSLAGSVINPLVRMNAAGQTGYGAFINWSTPKIDFVVIGSGGAITTLASPAIPSYPNNSSVTVKLEVQGTNLRFKSWPSGTAEPTSWTATTTDSTYAAAGYCGLSSQGGAVDNLYFGPAETTFSGGFLAPVLSSGSITSASAQLNWTAAGQAAGAITYQLMRSPHGANTFAAVSGSTASPAVDTSVTPLTVYDYRVTASDGVNAPVSSNVLSLTTQGLSAATSYTLGGPSAGVVGQASAEFTVSLNGPYTGTITISPSGCGLTTPIVLTFANSSSPQSFTLTPTSTGMVTLTFANSHGLLNPGVASFQSVGISPTVAGSGQAIWLESLDSGGNLSPFSEFQPGDEVQTLVFNGIPAGSGALFSFNGQTTTTAVPVTLQTPSGYGLYTIPVTAGMAYQIDMSLGPLSVPWQADWFSHHVSVQILDGSRILGSFVVDQSTSATVDYTLADTTSSQTGDVLNMKRLGSFTPSGSTLKIWVCSTVNDTAHNVVCDLFLLTPTTGSPIYADDGNSAIFSQQNFTINQEFGTGNPTPPGDCIYGKHASYSPYTPGGSSGPVAYSASASAIQSALQALSTIGSGNLVVADVSGIGSGPFTLTFTGTLAGAGQNLITCTDPAVSITRTAPGGQFITVNVTPASGSPYSFPIKQVIWGSGININNSGSNAAPYLPVAQLNFPQSAPAFMFFGNQQGFSNFNGWSGQNLGAGYSGYALKSSTAGDSTTLVMPINVSAVGTATYSIYLTWINSSLIGGVMSGVVTDTVSGTTLTSFNFTQPSNPASGSQSVTVDGFAWDYLASFTAPTGSKGFTLVLTVVSGTVATDAVMLARTSADLSIKIQPTDVVTLNVPANYVSNVAGVIPAVTNLPVTNMAGGSTLPALDPTTVTMPQGYNVEPDAYYYPCLLYNDLIRRIDSPFNNAVATDSRNFPTLLSSQTSNQNALSAAADGEFGLGKGVYQHPPGAYTILWGGPDILSFGNYGPPPPELTQYKSITGVNNVRVFNLQPGNTQFSFPLLLDITSGASGPNGSGQWPLNITYLHVYPPDPSDPTGMTPMGINSTPGKFHPTAVARLAGSQSVRSMDWLSTNAAAVAEMTDFLQPGMIQGPIRTINATITSLTQYTGTALCNPNDEVLALVTTAEPHGGFSGLPVLIYGTGITIEFSDGTSFSPTQGNNIYGEMWVVDATHFQIQLNKSSNNGAVTITNTVTSGTVTGTVGSAGILDDIPSLLALAAPGAVWWANVPTSASNNFATQFGQWIAANISPSNPVHLEYSNEHWNYGFVSYRICRSLGYQLTGTDDGGGTLGYVLRANALYNLIIEAAQAAGWTGTFKRVMGSQGGNTGVTSAIITDCAAHGITFDVLAVADYFSPQAAAGWEPTMQSLYDSMTPYGSPANTADTSGGQSMDWFELMVEYGGQEDALIGQHRTILNAAGLTSVTIENYESGFGQFVPASFGGGPENNGAFNGCYRNQVLRGHTRMFNAMLRYSTKAQNAGATRRNIFFNTGGTNYAGSGQYQLPNDWATYDSFGQTPGTGNPAVDTNNNSQPYRWDLITSQIGGAINHWNSLVPIPRFNNVVTRNRPTKGNHAFASWGKSRG